jgi:hypothetical protein
MLLLPALELWGRTEIIAAPTSEVCQLLEEVKKGQAYAILHCTC